MWLKFNWISFRFNSNHGSESRDAHLNANSNSIQNDEDSRSSLRSIKSLNSPVSAETPPIVAPVISLNLNANSKKKRLEVKDIFNNDEDSEDVNGPKKRKLVPLGAIDLHSFYYRIFMILFSNL